VSLDAGPHRIRVLFYQGSGNSSLSVRWQGPGIEKGDIPAELLSHHPAGDAVCVLAGSEHAADGGDATQRRDSVVVITPYRLAGMWVFDDPPMGLRREPFMAGTPQMIDILVKDIPNAGQGFRLCLSSTPFPGHTHKLEWGMAEEGGHWYGGSGFRMWGWFSPPMFSYLKTVPRLIYLKAEPK
jgi:hypothetical protein